MEITGKEIMSYEPLLINYAIQFTSNKEKATALSQATIQKACSNIAVGKYKCQNSKTIKGYLCSIMHTEFCKN
ncbi:MAG: hypothetical protein IJY75_05465 [Bacteroidaceae bacterium]|nr:hypothetical protein [Bacteroidaceae bacterium]